MIPMIMLALALCVVGISLRCLRRARLDDVRQNLYRIRERLHDRTIAGEFSPEDRSVRGLLLYLRSLVHALENLSVVEMIFSMAESFDESPCIPWLKDPRLEKEAEAAVHYTIKGLLIVSFLSRVALHVAYWTLRATKPIAALRKNVTSRLARSLQSPM